MQNVFRFTKPENILWSETVFDAPHLTDQLSIADYFLNWSEMGSSAEAMQAAKVYRHLLKAVKKHVGKEEEKSHFTEFISQEFRKSHEQSDLSSIHQKIKLAHDYTFLLNSVHHHKDLLFSYNIAMDRTDEMKKVLGKSAASVGLQLPSLSVLIVG